MSEFHSTNPRPATAHTHAYTEIHAAEVNVTALPGEPGRYMFTLSPTLSLHASPQQWRAINAAAEAKLAVLEGVSA